MTTEERILQYLDGSLSEQESGELMHQLSVSPEKRVVLEQHIKLSELSRIGQKPFDVPPALEASLASRLPILAETEETLVGGTLSNANKFSFFHLLRIYPARFAMSAAAFLLSGAVLYWFVQSNSSVQPQSTVDIRSSQQPNISATTSTQNNGTNIASAATNTPLTDKTMSSSDTKVLGNHSSASYNNSMTTSSMMSSRRTSNTTRTSEDGNILNELRLANNTHHNNSVAKATKETMVSATTNEATPSRDNSAQRDIDIANDNASNTNIVSSSANNNIAIIPTGEVVYPNMSSTKFIPSSDNRNHQRLNPFERSTADSRSPFAIRASYGMGETFLYVPTGGTSYASRTESSPVIGVDYSISPYVTFGVEGGSSTILSLNSQSATETPVPGGVTRITTQSATTNSTEWFARGAVRYCINPFDRVRYECSLEGGALVSRSASPMVSVQALVGYGLSDALDVQFAALYSGVWTSSNTTSTQSTSTQPDGPIVYKVVNTPASTIFSPAFTLRVGLQYRF